MNDKEVRKMLEDEQIPKELDPANIKLMLDQKAPAMKRKRISVVSRFAAIAAACAVVSGTAVHFASQRKNVSIDTGTDEPAVTTENAVEATTEAATAVSHETVPSVKGPYMNGARDYDEIYSLFADSAERYKKEYYRSMNRVRYDEDGIAEEDPPEYAVENEDDAFTAPPGGKGGGGDYSVTFDQEENVLEADIVKTDGKRIYSINNYGKKAILHIADADNGELSDLVTIDIAAETRGLLGENYINRHTSVDDMYIYDDMILVIGNVFGQEKDSYVEECYWYMNSKNVTYVAAYSLDDSHECLGIFCQDGFYHDVRISPDGYMYLLTNYTTSNYITVEGNSDIERYIPEAGMYNDVKFLSPENIYMPESAITSGRYLSYTVIGSIDLNESEKMKPATVKALVHGDDNYGYLTETYCAPDDLYIVTTDYYQLPQEEVEYGHIEETETSSHITRIAIGKGSIEPAASAKIEGYVNDQFSMSEYDGYFRVATTRNKMTLEYTKGEYYDFGDSYAEGQDSTPKLAEYGYYDYKDNTIDNILYVFDLDMKEVGYIDDFGNDEQVRSVSFGGDKAYVTTFRQTDPLYAIDLSDPASPVILSEYKMNGYSSYLQKWDDGLLIGFGADADETGMIQGLKLTMFDNSDPNDLKAVDSYVMDWDDVLEDENGYCNSNALWERKSLIIDPKKNIIAFPYYMSVYREDGDSYYNDYYRFFSFENGSFVEKGTLYGEYDKDEYSYGSNSLRALYIGDYVYIVSDNGITSADIESITRKDSLTFEEVYEYEIDDYQ